MGATSAMVEKKASLTVLGGPLAGLRCVLPDSGIVTIGSASGSTLRLDTPGVSPYHARLTVREGRITVHETGAERRLHVNDDPLDLDGTVLRNGDILWLGPPGEEDVVMLQCGVPSAPVAGPMAAKIAPGGPFAPTPDIETQALWATEPPLPPPVSPRVGAGAVEGAVTGYEETVALDLELGLAGGPDPPAAWVDDSAVAVAEVEAAVAETLVIAPEAMAAGEPLVVVAPEEAGAGEPLVVAALEFEEKVAEAEEQLVVVPEGMESEEPLVVAPGWERR